MSQSIIQSGRLPGMLPYSRKLRFLVTSDCAHRCPFCHNEGQRRGAGRSMEPALLQPHLRLLRRISGHVTLSGGEPLQAPKIQELVSLLASFNFDITLVTAGAELVANRAMLPMLTSLHVSMVALNEAHALANCNGNLLQKMNVLRSVAKWHPELQLCINIPYVGQRDICEILQESWIFARELKAKVKVIGEFSYVRSSWLRPRACRDWETRWDPVLRTLATGGFKRGTTTIRETEFMDSSNTLVELSEVACASVGSEYAAGVCFGNMDITVDPDLNVSLCRWQSNKVSLAEMSTGRYSIGTLAGNLIKADTNGCPFSIVPHPLDTAGLGEFIVEEHESRDVSEGAIASVVATLRQGDASIYGRSGVVATFEREFASYHGVPYAFATSSGSASLFLAYLAIGVSEGTEIVASTYCYPGAIAPLLLLGASVRFCDADPLTGNFDMLSLEKAVTERTRVVLVTHMWGAPASVAQLGEFCRLRNIQLIEDCSHAVGAQIDGRKVGTFGAVACFSLQQNKAVCAGEGGVLITKDPEVYERAVLFGSLRRRVLDSVHNVDLRSLWDSGAGLKLKIHPLAAALALESLRALERVNEVKIANAERIGRWLGTSRVIRAPRTDEGTERRVYYTYKVLVRAECADGRDWVVDALLRRGIPARVSDLRPMHIVLAGRTGTPFGGLAGGNAAKGRVVWQDRYPGADSYVRSAVSLPAPLAPPEGLLDYYGRTLADVAARLELDLAVDDLTVGLQNVATAEV